MADADTKGSPPPFEPEGQPEPKPDGFEKPEVQKPRPTGRQGARLAALDRRTAEIKGAAKDARASATDILRKWDGLSISGRRQIATAFRSVMIPRRRAGRKPSPALTAAYHDWKSDIRGVALFRKHILNWEHLSRWRRGAEQRSLMDAIYSRNRRAKQSAITAENPK